jgi:hypothetical protein
MATTGDAINNIADKIGDGLVQLGTALASKAPEAWALVVKGNYAVAVANIIQGVPLLLASSGSLYVGYRLLSWGFKIKKEQKSYGSTDGFAQALLGCILMALSIIALLVIIVNDFDAHTIAMLIAPDATTARDLLLRAVR